MIFDQNRHGECVALAPDFQVSMTVRNNECQFNADWSEASTYHRDGHVQVRFASSAPAPVHAAYWEKLYDECIRMLKGIPS